MAHVDVARYRARSLWLDRLGDHLAPRPALDTDLQCDVAIVGAGLTGLWTAYSLVTADPSLRIAVVERDIVGFGASGRNGGWASAGIAGSPGRYARQHGVDAVRRATRATNDAVDEIGRVVALERIDCAYAKQGTLTVVTSEPQRARLLAAHEASRSNGTHNDDDQLLTAEGVARHARVAGTLAGAFTPHCAGVDPARLTRGLAEACERHGVRIYEQTAVHDLHPGHLHTDHGAVRADIVLRTTESYTVQLPGHRRDYLPLTSLMIATEPLPAGVWDELGWPRGMTMKDKRHLFFYAQRTDDDRIAIGGRGAPYALRRSMDASREQAPDVRARLANVIRTHFPAAADAAITHHWGGTLAVPRDWTSAVHYDPASRTGWAGGYSGHGVVAAHLSGRTLADLVLGRTTELTSMPWVDHRSRRWEPEPLRWLASQGIVRMLGSADRYEDATGNAARRVRMVRRWLPPA
ncbi:MAG: NAD(P)/FAD-dependent oxidoreductase [Ilumatobacteraceae bacterium]